MVEVAPLLPVVVPPLEPLVVVLADELVVVPTAAPPLVDVWGAVIAVVVTVCGGAVPLEFVVVGPTTAVVDVVVVEVLVVPVDAAAAVEPVVGTVSWGAPLVSVVAAPPLPHAATAAAASMPAASAPSIREQLCGRDMS